MKFAIHLNTLSLLPC